MTTLDGFDEAWYPASSADDLHADEEVDLAKFGNPGGAEWAYVANEGDTVVWCVLDRWLWDDAKELERGQAASAAEGRAAVQAWVTERLAEEDQS